VRAESALENDAVVVEVVDRIKDRADDSDVIIFSKLAFCLDTLVSSKEKQYFV